MVIWHNPNCSKSRATIEALNSKEISYTTREYLDDVPSKDEIIDVLNKLGFDSPKDMMRTKEVEYQEMNLADNTKSKDDLINAMIKVPKLIERPIAITNSKAAIGRPLENILNII